MAKFRISVPVRVEIVAEIEADDEFKAHDIYEELDFGLEERIGKGGVCLEPITNGMVVGFSEPDYDKTRIEEIS